MQLIYLSFANCNTLVQRNAQSHTSARIMTNEDHNILIKCSKAYFNVSCNFVLKAIKILHFSSIKKKKKEKRRRKRTTSKEKDFIVTTFPICSSVLWQLTKQIKDTNFPSFSATKRKMEQNPGKEKDNKAKRDQLIVN